MVFDCKVNIVDEIMGAGKSSAAINFINSSPSDTKFLVITPYLKEIERYRKSCPKKYFEEPKLSTGKGSKLRSIKTLISKGKNIVSTHALFRKFDNELIDLCRIQNYTLIMDEVAEIIEQYNITPHDLIDLKTNYIDIDEKTGMITWKENAVDYSGVFADIKRLCDLGSLSYYGGNVMMWLFPVGVFNAFRNVYILTYMFNAQLQKYYYDYHKVPYRYLYVEGNDIKTYRFTEKKTTNPLKYDYKNLIHIVDNEKMNMIGDRTNDLSKAWFQRNGNFEALTPLSKHLANFFRNVTKAKTSDCLWTTFVDFRHYLRGQGYSKGFLALNARAENSYQDRHNVAYIVNIFINPVVKQFFTSHNIFVDDDGYALSEMLQFIWRSAIRNGEEIWIYIPSKRMRDLLCGWLKIPLIE